ncbi:MAG: hypothetical protein ACRCR9_04875 [Chitinophagaceae bacterium]
MKKLMLITGLFCLAQAFVFAQYSSPSSTDYYNSHGRSQGSSKTTTDYFRNTNTTYYDR